MHLLACLAALPLALGAEPLTNNAIQNLHPNTGNRLAFNRAALPDTGLTPDTCNYWEWSSEHLSNNCTHLDKLDMYFELASTWDAGTLHPVQIEFPGTEWQPPAPKAELRPGFHEWQAIRIYELLSSVTFSYKFRSRIPGLRMKFRGHCADSDIWIDNNKFASLDKTMTMKESTMGKFIVWEDSLELTDWVSRPACSHLKQLQVGLQLADQSWAGTGNDLRLSVGNSDSLLAHDPSRGEKFENTIDLKEAFGKPIVPLTDIKNIKIYNKGEDEDKFLPEEITIRGTCHGPLGIELEFKKQMDDWVPDTLEVTVDSEGWESKVKRS